jgi:NIMA (never in mitosis gene a)-related kinase
MKRIFSNSCCLSFRKVLKAIFIDDISPNESLAAEHEAAILVRLRHPNIIRFYDSFIDISYFCIVTEYCEVKILLNEIIKILFLSFIKGW